MGQTVTSGVAHSRDRTYLFFFGYSFTLQEGSTWLKCKCKQEQSDPDELVPG